MSSDELRYKNDMTYQDLQRYIAYRSQNSTMAVKDIDELVSFIEQVEKEAIEGERERIYLAFQSFAAKYSLDRPIPPAELRLFLEQTTKTILSRPTTSELNRQKGYL